MSDLAKKPVAIAVVVVLLILVAAFAWRQYRAITGVTKENTVQLTPDELRNAMRRDN
jgi:uncharacterized phage infection (PIP) family protein YhgE